MTEPCFADMIQEHLLKNAFRKNIENQELGNLKRFPVKRALMQGNYSGIGIEKVNNQWRFRNKIAGFDSSARYFEITDAGSVSHEYKAFLGYS
jgi:hypothetical protein